MLVVTPFDEQGEVIAQRADQAVGPGSQRQHRLLGVHTALGGQHGPAFALGLQAGGVARQDTATPRDEQIGITLHQCTGVVHCPRVQPMHGPSQRGTQSGLSLGQLGGVFGLRAHTKTHAQIFGTLRRLVQSLGRAEHKAKAFTRDQILRTRSGDQQVVLVSGVGDQAAVGLGGLRMPLGV